MAIALDGHGDIVQRFGFPQVVDAHTLPIY